VSLLFTSELDKLRARGIAVADLEPDELEALVHACDRMASPFSDVNADAAGMPLPVGNGVYFWRPTIGACLWLDEYAGKWWKDRPMRLKWAFVYALVHAREPDAFSSLTKEDEAEAAIKREALRLVVNEGEVDAALDRLFPADESKSATPPPEAQPDWAAILARLETQTGIPSRDWMWGKSSAYALRCYCDLTHFAAASGGAKAQRMRDERDRAANALARLGEAISSRIGATREDSQ
jgi:hypothetical protein